MQKSDIVLGFFDSGLGGQVVMQAFQREFPDMRMILEMDRENVPYGGRTGEEIRELTYAGVQRLWDRGADVVILACNTASVHALRPMQQEVFRGRHILGVTIPGAEAVVEGGYQKIGVLATEATVRTRMYRERVHILDDSILVEEVGAPGLTPLIEKGILNGSEIETLLRDYLSKFSPDIEALVLGCTHYPLIRESIERVWGEVHGKDVETSNLGSCTCDSHSSVVKERGVGSFSFDLDSSPVNVLGIGSFPYNSDPSPVKGRGGGVSLEAIFEGEWCRFSPAGISINRGSIHQYRPDLREYARENRKIQNPSEKFLWSALRNTGIGYKAHRQKPIGEYIADFYLPDLQLVIEIDGDSHDDRLSYDRERTKYLNNIGIHVLRYTDREVRDTLEWVILNIRNWVDRIQKNKFTLILDDQSKPTLTLPSQGGDRQKKSPVIIDPGKEAARMFRGWMERKQIT